MKKSKPGKSTRARASDARSSGASDKAVDAVKLIKSDHREVEELFKQCSKVDDEGEKADLVRRICDALTIHAMIEEEIFYPACREADVKSDLLDEAQVEHDGAKLLIAELKSGSPGDEYFDAKLTVLEEYIKHHVAEEEKARGGILALAKKAGIDMTEIGEQLQERKAELEEQAQSDDLPEPEIASMHLAAQSGGGRRRADGGRRSAGARNLERTDDEAGAQGEGRGGRGRRGGWFGDSEGHAQAAKGGSAGGGEGDDDIEDDNGPGSRDEPERDQEGRFMSEDRPADEGEDQKPRKGGAGRGRGGSAGESEGQSRSGPRVR